jgi:hypothetical protein
MSWIIGNDLGQMQALANQRYAEDLRAQQALAETIQNALNNAARINAEQQIAQQQFNQTLPFKLAELALNRSQLEGQNAERQTAAQEAAAKLGYMINNAREARDIQNAAVLQRAANNLGLTGNKVYDAQQIVERITKPFINTYFKVSDVTQNFKNISKTINNNNVPELEKLQTLTGFLNQYSNDPYAFATAKHIVRNLIEEKQNIIGDFLNQYSKNPTNPDLMTAGVQIFGDSFMNTFNKKNNNIDDLINQIQRASQIKSPPPELIKNAFYKLDNDLTKTIQFSVPTFARQALQEYIEPLAGEAVKPYWYEYLIPINQIPINFKRQTTGKSGPPDNSINTMSGTSPGQNIPGINYLNQPNNTIQTYPFYNLPIALP